MEGNGQMFEIEELGRTIRVKPVGAVLHHETDGAIVLERTAAIRLVTELDSALRLPAEEMEGEDG